MGDIEKVFGIVLKPDDSPEVRQQLNSLFGPNRKMEAPATAMWKFKGRACLGILDENFSPEMAIRSTYGRSDNYFEIHSSRGAHPRDPLHRRDHGPALPSC